MIWVHLSVGVKLGQTTSASSLIWNNHSRRGGSRKCQVANLFHHLIAVLPGWMVVLVEILCPYPNYNYQLKTVLWGGTPNTDKVIKISFIFIARRHTRTANAVDGSGTTAVSTTRLRVAIYISHFSCETLLWATMSTVGLCLRLNCRKREYICRTILDEPPSPPSWVILETSQGKTN